MTKYQNKWRYTVYKGDKFIFEGTSQEICEKLNIKYKTFIMYRTKWYKEHRETKLNNRIIIIRNNGLDRTWDD